MEKQSAQLITLYGFREADKWGVTEVCLDRLSKPRLMRASALPC